YGNDRNGTAASVGAIARDDLTGFAARRFHRKGLIVGAVGDITAAELSGLVDTVFGGLPVGGGDDARARIADARPTDDGALVVSRAKVPQSAVSFGQAGPKRDDPDWYAAYVLNDVIGGSGFRGRLMKEI